MGKVGGKGKGLPKLTQSIVNGAWTVQLHIHTLNLWGTCCYYLRFKDKEIKLVSPKGIFIGRTYAKPEAPILWSPDAKIWLIGKDPEAGKDWGKKEKQVTEDEMVRWHHQLNGHEFEQILGDGEGQRSLACCSLWVTKCQTRLSEGTELNGWIPKP